MSYKVLARKWRPQHFRDMLGQEPVLRALINALDSDRLHHAYLFTGMRGVGKTTIARIFAKCLNCEANGVSSDPCGQCSACLDIEAGRFFDLIEVDAASRTKVEGTRELLENVPYAPASGRYKVYLIDEVHMFSTHSFNALLKTLEEPPEHVKFLLATTDPQKVPATVLSRCLQFNLKRMTPALLTEYLSSILSEEGIKFEIPALDLIARASEGSVRDALSLVEQASAFGEGSIQATDVEGMLGRASVDRLLSLLETLAQDDMPALFAQVDTLAQYAPDFHELLGEILSLLHRVALLQTVKGAVADSVSGYDRLASLAASIDADAVQLFYQIGLHARRDMPFAPDTREAFDMALLRMNAFKPQGGSGALPPGPGSGGDSRDVIANDGRAQVNAPSGVSAASAAQSMRSPADGAAQSAGMVAAAPSSATSSATPSATKESVDAKPGGLPVRGEVSAGGSLRAAALAAARGEALPDETAAIQREQPRVTRSTPLVSPAQSGVAGANTAEADVAADESGAGRPAGAVDKPSTEGVSAENGGATGNDTAKPIGNAVTDSSSTLEIRNDQDAPANDGSMLKLDKNSLAPADWPHIVRQLDIAGMPLQLASNCELLEISAQSVKLRLQKDSEHLNTARFLDRVETALCDWLGRAVKLQVGMVEECLATPAKLTEQQVADELAAAHASINQDPIVQQLIDKVDGAVDKSSIRPLNGS